MKTLNTSVRFYLLITILFVLLASQMSASPMMSMDTHMELVDQIAPAYQEADIDLAGGAGMGNMSEVLPETSWISAPEYVMHLLIMLIIGAGVIMKSGGRNNFFMG